MKHLIYWSIAIILMEISICIIDYAGLLSVNAQVAVAYACGIVQSIIMFIVAEKIYGAHSINET